MVSKPKQSIDLDDQNPVRQHRKLPGVRVALLVEDDEDLAAGRVLPPEPDVRRHGSDARVVLHERAGEHARRHGVGGARPDQVGRE